MATTSNPKLFFPPPPPLIVSGAVSFATEPVPLLTVPPPLWIYGLNTIPLRSMTTKERNNQTLSHETIWNILNQFVGNTDYDTNSRTVVDAFIDELQSYMAFIIPTVVNDLCFAYYFQTDNKYVHLAFNLYQSIHPTSTDTSSIAKALFTENELVSESYFQSDNTKQICQKLVQLDLIRLATFKTTFLSLFKKSNVKEAQSIDMLSNVKDVRYRLTDDVVRAFLTYQSKQCRRV
eukprot:77738_1